MLSSFSTANLNVFSSLSVPCVFHGNNHYHRLVFWTVFPIVVGLALSATYFLARSVHKRGHQKVGGPGVSAWIEANCFSGMLLTIFVVFPTVCNTIFQTFACVALDDGTSFLQADLSVSCQTKAYGVAVVYAAAMAALYTIGIPCWYLFVLNRHRDLLSDPTIDREDHPDIKHLSFLFSNYRPEAWFMEVVELVRKVGHSAVQARSLARSVTQALRVNVSRCCSRECRCSFCVAHLPKYRSAA